MARVLVVQLARMGDVLQSGRLIVSLRREHEVHLCVDASLLAFAQKAYPFAQVHGIAAQRLPEADAFARNRKVFSELRECGFSEVFNLNFSGMNLAISRLFEPEIMHGHWLERGQARRDRWVDFVFRWTGQRRLAPLNLADIWAFLVPSPVAPPDVNPDAVPGGRGVGVVISGRSTRRSLPPETLAPIVTAVFERQSARKGKAADVFLFGSTQEYAGARKLMRLLPPHVLRQVHDLTGKTGLLELGEYLAGLDVLLTPDTGLMHLAARYGVPVEAFFLSSAWCFETGPYGKGHIVWQTLPTGKLDCVPCLETGSCSYATACGRPFSTPEFIAMERNGENRALPGIAPFETEFDALGVVCEPLAGRDLCFGRREAMRRIIGEWLGYYPDSFETDNAIADEFYREGDWMLPAR